MSTPTRFDRQAQDAQRLLVLSDDARRIDSINAAKARTHRLTGADLDRAISAHREVEQACEAFRRRYYPRSGAVSAALGMVSVLSPKGRRGRIVAEAAR